MLIDGKSRVIVLFLAVAVGDLIQPVDLVLEPAVRRAGIVILFLGLLPGGGGAWYLPQLVGRAWALELLLSADFIDAEDALRIGLVNHVYPDDKLMSEARALALRMTRLPPFSVRAIKRAVDHAANADMATCLDLVSSHIAIAKSGQDHAEAIRAFREKRDGVFTGE